MLSDIGLCIESSKTSDILWKCSVALRTFDKPASLKTSTFLLVPRIDAIACSVSRAEVIVISMNSFNFGAIVSRALVTNQ